MFLLSRTTQRRVITLLLCLLCLLPRTVLALKPPAHEPHKHADAKTKPKPKPTHTPVHQKGHPAKPAKRKPAPAVHRRPPAPPVRKPSPPHHPAKPKARQKPPARRRPAPHKPAHRPAPRPHPRKPFAKRAQPAGHSTHISGRIAGNPNGRRFLLVNGSQRTQVDGTHAAIRLHGMREHFSLLKSGTSVWVTGKKSGSLMVANDIAILGGSPARHKPHPHRHKKR